MLKKVSYIFLATVILAFVYGSACCPREDFCASFDSISLNAFDITGDSEVQVTTQPVKGDSLMLQLLLRSNINSCSNSSFSPLVFINTAYAYSCDNKNYYRNDTVRSILIKADKPYGSLHPAGTGLNEFFNVPTGSEITSNSEVDSFRINALVPPAEEGQYIFTIVLSMTSGRIYEANTDPVNIIK